MARRRGPIDQGLSLSTTEMLTAVWIYGRRWPESLARMPIEVVAAAVAREIMAGNLYDAATLTPAGRRLLEDTEHPTDG